MRQRRKRKEELAFDPATGEVDVEGTVELRHALDDDEWPIKFEPPPGGEKGWAQFALNLLGLDSDITQSEQAVLAVLIEHANAITGQCNPSVTRIAKGVGRHRRTVFRALDGLYGKGLVTNLAVNHNGARRRVGNAYQVTWGILVETLTEYEKRVAKAKSMVANGRKPSACANGGSDNMMSPPSDTMMSPQVVTTDVTLNLEIEPRREPSTPKVDHLTVARDQKPTDTQALKRIKANRMVPPNR